MNRIYRVIWSRAKNCCVVVSEMANSRTKSHGRRIVKKTALAAMVFSRTEPVRHVDVFLCGG